MDKSHQIMWLIKPIFILQLLKEMLYQVSWYGNQLIFALNQQQLHN